LTIKRWPSQGYKRHVLGDENGQIRRRAVRGTSERRASMIGFVELTAFAIALVLAVEFGRIAKSRGVSAWMWGSFVFVSLLFAAVLANRGGQTWSYVAAVLVVVASAAACYFPVVQRPILETWQDIAYSKILTFGLLTVPKGILGTLILVGIAVNFANVVGRYVFFAPIIWAEEAMIFIMVWTVLSGAILASWDGGHLKMDFFSIMLPTPWKEILNFSSTTIFLMVCVFVLPQSFKVVDLMARLDQRSVILGMPMVIPHFAILLGFFLMFVAVAVRFRMYVTGSLDSDVAVPAAKLADSVPGDGS
jgi:TRAP-type C4-dicarboxylate transport system permease small subunit